MAALRGINPVTLEKPAIRRHEMQSMIAFKVLQSLESQLRGHLLEATESLGRAEDLVSQILTAGIDSRLGKYVRAQKGLAYSVYGMFQPNRQAGRFLGGVV